MTCVRDVYAYIDSLAPFATAMEFDNAGLLVGNGKENVTKGLLSLDITPQAVERAEEIGAQLIISHHPVIFSPLRRLSPESVPYRLVESGVAAICAHTNLDMAALGVNHCLAERLSLQNIHGVSEYAPGASILWEGDLPFPMAPKAFALYVKERLGCEAVELAAGRDHIKRVALCSGAGAEYMAEVEDAQAFLTGEAKHHEWLAAHEKGITLVVAGHYSTEAVVLEPLAALLRERFEQVEWTVFTGEPPMRFL